MKMSLQEAIGYILEKLLGVDEDLLMVIHDG